MARPALPSSTRRNSPRRWRRWLVLMLTAPPLLSALMVLSLRWLDPPSSAFMIAERMQTGAWPRFQWRAIDQVSPQLPLAMVAAEDQRFPKHAGFDLQSIQAALASSGTDGRGASTISQQVAKNLFLWKQRSWLRKGLEVWFTVLIETCWDKRRILEVYLNIAELGPGIYGAEAAARYHFSTSAGDLNRHQSAQLAAILPNPRRYSATKPSPYVRGRVQWVEQQMGQLGGEAYLRELLGNAR